MEIPLVSFPFSDPFCLLLLIFYPYDLTSRSGCVLFLQSTCLIFHRPQRQTQTSLMILWCLES